VERIHLAEDTEERLAFFEHENESWDFMYGGDLGSLVTVSFLTSILPVKVILFSCQVKLVQLSHDSAGTCTCLSCAVDMHSNILSQYMCDYRRGMDW
jgi:hypothetical protein